MIQYTRTTVLWPWTTSVKVMLLPCSATPTNLFVADVLMVIMPEETGSFPMDLEFLALVSSGNSTEQEVRWGYFCTGGEVEWMEFTTVRYLMSWISTREYTLECTQKALVRDQYVLFIHFKYTCTGICSMKSYKERVYKFFVLLLVSGSGKPWIHVCTNHSVITTRVHARRKPHAQSRAWQLLSMGSDTKW